MLETLAKRGTDAFYVVAALVLLLAGGIYAFGEYGYLVQGVTTDAAVVGVDSETVAPGERRSFDEPVWYEHRVRYEYRDGEGVAHQGVDVSRSQFRQSPRRSGDTLRVRYLATAPATSRVTSSWRPSDQHWGVLLAALALGAAMIGAAAYWTRRDSLESLVAALGSFPLLPSRGRERRRERLARTPFPEEWLAYLRANVRAYGLLGPADRARLRHDLRIFLAERRWEGCAGLTVTDEMKVTISAQACVLLLAMRHDYFGDVSSILVYPSAFRTPRAGEPDGTVGDTVATLGQAWYRGPVILAWDEVLADGRGARPGHNVVYHEFAHRLDFAGEWREGKGPRDGRARWERWQKVMGEEYGRLVRESEQGRATVLDDYGATSPREFFAVATESFFEKPGRLKERHPRLYEVLCDYYGQDPLEWSGRP
jgi:Mlc titration factor MtfA (ptsG expression regulator)